jgi:hypothetical protein
LIFQGVSFHKLIIWLYVENLLHSNITKILQVVCIVEKKIF